MPRIDLIQKRRDTAANWTSANPVLADGEEGYEKDTGLSKIGDGITAWNALDYFDPVVPGTYVRSAATRAALTASGPLARTLVLEVGGAYRYDAASAATVNGWTILAAPGGVGRFIYDEPALTLPIRGGGLDDWPNFGAANAACAAAGVTLLLGDGLYECKSRQSIASGAHIVCTPKTLIHCDIPFTDGGTNLDAPFCGAGLTLDGTNIATDTNIGDMTVVLTANFATHPIAVGDMITLFMSPTSFRGNIYQVIAYDPSTKTVTLDRPLRLTYGHQQSTKSFPAPGYVSKLAPARDIIVEFNGARIYGNAKRYVEFIRCWNCKAIGPVYLGDGTAVTATERLVSLDTPSWGCTATKMIGDGGGVTTLGGSFEVGEGNTVEDSSFQRCGNGFIFQDALDCEARNVRADNNIGAGVVFTAAVGGTADGILGADGCRFTGGSASGNGTHGVVFERGSSRNKVDGAAIVGNVNDGAVVLAGSMVATVTNKALTTNVATLTTLWPHGLDVGASVVVAGVDATFNGTYTVTSTPTATTFTYAKVNANVASVASGGTVTADWRCYDNAITGNAVLRKNGANGLEIQKGSVRTVVSVAKATDNQNGIIVAVGAIQTALVDLDASRNGAGLFFQADVSCERVTCIPNAGATFPQLTVTAGTTRVRGSAIEMKTNSAASVTISSTGKLDIDATTVTSVPSGIGIQVNGASASAKIGSGTVIIGHGAGGIGVYCIGSSTVAIASGVTVDANAFVAATGGTFNFGTATVGATNVVVPYPQLKVTDVVVVTRTSGSGAFTVTQTAGTGFTITGTTGDVFGWKVV